MATHSCCYLICLHLVLTALQILDLRSTYIRTGCLPFHTFGTVCEMQLSVSRIILSQDVSAYDWVALASFAQVHALKVSVYYPSDLKFIHMILTSATALKSLKLGFVVSLSFSCSINSLKLSLNSHCLQNLKVY